MYRYAIIGTGIPWRTEGSTGFGMANAHYPSMKKTGKVECVAISELLPERAQRFLEKHELQVPTYSDYKEMLAIEKPEIVSICTWPEAHAELTLATIEAGVKVIYCEKPIAVQWGDCKRMVAAAKERGTILAFNHQRRHIQLFQTVRNAIQSGAIGELVQIEAECGNLYDWGTHWLDMMFFYNGDVPAEWVIGQINSQTENTIFGARMEDQAICHWKWQNGVRGYMVTGHEASIGATHRIIGKEGVIEVLNERDYRILGKGRGEWEQFHIPQGDLNELELTAADIVRALDEPGHTPIVSAKYALQSTEVIFATYRSSQIHGRVDLPLTYDGNSLLEMMDSGIIGPQN